MTMTTTYAGMDAHARTIHVAVLAPGAERPEEWQLANEPRAVKRLAQRLKRMEPGPVVACYEAGPGGFALQRRLKAEGIECRVIAPALIPRRPGDRAKTDRRDARRLAELLRADLLTAVHPPTTEPVVVRDSLTQEDAAARAERVSDVSYDLHLDLTAGAERYRGDDTIRFALSGGSGGSGDVFLDHTGDATAVRLIVRRVQPTPGSQLALFVDYSYHAFITDRAGETLELEADHRRHAEIENAIRDLKYGVGLNHLPSGRFAANAAWLAVQVIAHNLARWTARLGLGEGIVTTRTLRRRYFALAGRLTHSARRWTLHLPRRWPWAGQLAAALARLRAIPLPA